MYSSPTKFGHFRQGGALSILLLCTVTAGAAHSPRLAGSEQEVQRRASGGLTGSGGIPGSGGSASGGARAGGSPGIYDAEDDSKSSGGTATGGRFGGDTGGVLTRKGAMPGAIQAWEARSATNEMSLFQGPDSVSVRACPVGSGLSRLFRCAFF